MCGSLIRFVIWNIDSLDFYFSIILFHKLRKHLLLRLFTLRGFLKFFDKALIFSLQLRSRHEIRCRLCWLIMKRSLAFWNIQSNFFIWLICSEWSNTKSSWTWFSIINYNRLILQSLNRHIIFQETFIRWRD
jgi:hypothetical protein